MLNDPVWIALIAVVSAFLTGPIAAMLMAWITYRQRRRDRLDDYARQDAVAAKLLASNQRVADRANVTNEKLDVIHTLVNSRLTEAKQAQLAALNGQLATMRELVAFKVTRNEKPSQHTTAALQALETAVVELTANVSDRLATQRGIDQDKNK